MSADATASEVLDLLILQTPQTPALVRHAIIDLLDVQTSDVRIASAYVTRGGSDIFFRCLSEFLRPARINEIEKTLVASLDFGLTEPEALSHWKSLPNATVHVAGAHLIASGSLIPVSAFHPKIYAFGVRGAHANVLVGSANLTNRGLSINTEAVWAERELSLAKVNAIFAAVAAGTTLLTDELLAAYRALRKRNPPPPALLAETAPVPRPAAVPGGRLPTFRDAVENGTLDPTRYRQLWIQVEALQGGSGNQLELPRGAHRFFGFEFEDYDFPNKTTIGVPVLRAGSREWRDRLLTWHGNNKMERMNLPTASQGGFRYENAAIMFRRLRDGSFELIVAPWESDLARSWREASAQRNLLFRLGAIATSRVVGLI